MSTAWLWLALAFAAPPEPEADGVERPSVEAPSADGPRVLRVGPPPAIQAPEPAPAAQPPERQIPTAEAEGSSPPDSSAAGSPEPAAPATPPPAAGSTSAPVPTPVSVPMPVYLDFTGPMPEPTVLPDAAQNSWDALLPAVQVRGFWNGLLLLTLMFAFATLAQLLGRARAELAATGILPNLTRVAGTLSRVLAVFFGLGVIGAWTPASVAPALPWILIGGAAALGWSARDVLPDVVAWMFLTVEGRVRPGMWIHGDGYAGEVRLLGLRAAVLADSDGHELILPNRRLVGESVHRDTAIWPLVEVPLRAPPELPIDQIRDALRDACLGSPWVAPVPDLEVLSDPTDNQQWTVRLRLIEGQYLAAFRGSLRERMLAELAHESGHARD